MSNIFNGFPITDKEYECLEKEFGQLAKYAAWQLLRKNSNNNHTDDFEDVNQELIMSLIRAGSYYKRQVYIEECFRVAFHYADGFISFMLQELEKLWKNRTRHGANRQKFGPYQERILSNIIRTTVPKKFRPSKKMPLKIDSKFATYCKAIAWNAQKSVGRKITKEKSIRGGITSLSEYDYLAEV